MVLKTFVFGMIFLSGLSFGFSHGESKTIGRSDEISDKDQVRAFAKALEVVFKDPATGQAKTKDYEAYLKWQASRSVFVGQMLDAKSDTEKSILARKLTRLDQDFRLFNSKILRAMDLLSQAESKLFADGSALEKIKNLDPKSYEAWQKQREALVDSLKKETNDQKKFFLIGKLKLVDRSFRLQFMGFLLGLPID